MKNLLEFSFKQSFYRNKRTHLQKIENRSYKTINNTFFSKSVNYFLYHPPKDETATRTESQQRQSTYVRQQRLPRYISMSEDNLVQIRDEDADTALVLTAEHLSINQNAGESVLNPMQQSLIFSNAELI